MEAGEIVLACVNGGAWEEALVLEINGEIARVAGVEERRIVQRSGRSPLGVGFPVHKLKTMKKVKEELTIG